jgi:hypothetical protein
VLVVLANVPPDLIFIICDFWSGDLLEVFENQEGSKKEKMENTSSSIIINWHLRVENIPN